mmetsp:Transcript_8272/g.14973  ORF Transcript_8272/g.14973 Transcript_8272/m.14973 type:complete len:224 (+) Transcript_8272:63-734(+)
MNRGALIVFEGLDRSGKSSQARALVSELNARAIPVAKSPNGNGVWCFPDRTTQIGKIIDSYLQSKSLSSLNLNSLHLLFSANRWERAQDIVNALNAGFNVVLDRYAFSGVVYSSAQGLDMDWALNSDQGLPRPDLLLFLSVSAEVAAQRGNYGAERYENVEMQTRVADQFQVLLDSAAVENLRVSRINGDESQDAVHREILQVVLKTIERVKSIGDPLGTLWT